MSTLYCRVLQPEGNVMQQLGVLGDQAILIAVGSFLEELSS